MVTALALLAMPALSLAAAVGSGGSGPSKIVGGDIAKAGDFPYIVSLSFRSVPFCGGSLVNAYTVLTAAHCTVDPRDNTLVRGGSLQNAAGGIQVGVTEIVVHPSYNTSTGDNDVALWHLSAPLAASSTIAYLTLPEQGSDPVPGSAATTAGWGKLTETGYKVPDDLMEVTVPILDRATCAAEYEDEEYYGPVTTSMFCAGVATGGKDACQGDSGGPIRDDATGTVIGVVSWGKGCARANFAGVYTRVGLFVEYINANKWIS